MHPHNDEVALVLGTIGQARRAFDLAILELRVQMELASWHAMPLGAIAGAALMRPVEAQRFLHLSPPCGLTEDPPEGCALCPENSCPYPEAA